MSVLTIHALDARVEQRIRRKAREEGKSLNQTMKELLALSVGVDSPPRPDHRADFAEFAGIWSQEEAALFEAAVADMETVDERDWQ